MQLAAVPLLLPLHAVLLLGGLDGAPHRLLLLVLGLQLPLQVEVELPLALDALLLHVADDALVHCLESQGSLVSGWSDNLKRAIGNVMV